MSRYTVLLAAIGISFLVACASEPTQDRYYSLVLAADDIPVQTKTNSAAARLTIGPIQVARYLSQAGLAMQKGHQQIQIANHSFWAEPLGEGIGKVLVRDISSRDSTLLVSRESGRWLGEGDCRLRLEFDKFQVTDSSSVVARGRYWISSTAMKRDEFQSEFDLVRELRVDGYANAVNELRALLGELSDQLVTAITRERLCTIDNPIKLENGPTASPVTQG